MSSSGTPSPTHIPIMSAVGTCLGGPSWQQYAWPDGVKHVTQSRVMMSDMVVLVVVTVLLNGTSLVVDEARSARQRTANRVIIKATRYRLLEAIDGGSRRWRVGWMVSILGWSRILSSG